MPISTGVIPHQKEKRGVLHCFVPPIVVCKFGQGEMSGPIGLLVVSKEPEVGLHPLIVPLGLSVHPGVVRRGDVLLDSQGVAQFLNELGGESRVSVTYDFVRESVSSDYGL